MSEATSVTGTEKAIQLAKVGVGALTFVIMCLIMCGFVTP